MKIVRLFLYIFLLTRISFAQQLTIPINDLRAYGIDPVDTAFAGKPAGSFFVNRVITVKPVELNVKSKSPYWFGYNLHLVKQHHDTLTLFTAGAIDQREFTHASYIWENDSTVQVVLYNPRKKKWRFAPLTIRAGNNPPQADYLVDEPPH